jgi:serine/threonine protein kinase
MAARRFGPFEIEALIGKGGMGEVFRARDTRLGRTVAIKMIPTHLSGRDELRQRYSAADDSCDHGLASGARQAMDLQLTEID